MRATHVVVLVGLALALAACSGSADNSSPTAAATSSTNASGETPVTTVTSTSSGVPEGTTAETDDPAESEFEALPTTWELVTAPFTQSPGPRSTFTAVLGPGPSGEWAIFGHLTDVDRFPQPVVWTSRDGENWTGPDPIVNPSEWATVTEATWSETEVVAIGETADGTPVAWRGAIDSLELMSTPAGAESLDHLAAGEGIGLVVTGETEDGRGLWRSADGVSWQELPLPDSVLEITYRLSDLAATPDSILLSGDEIAGDSTTIVLNPDGAVIESPTIPAAAGDFAVSGATIVLLASGSSGQPPRPGVWKSDDGGRTWIGGTDLIEASTGEQGYELSEATVDVASDGSYVAAGSTDAWTSTDGVAWNRIENPQVIAGPNTLAAGPGGAYVSVFSPLAWVTFASNPDTITRLAGVAPFDSPAPESSVLTYGRDGDSDVAVVASRQELPDIRASEATVWRTSGGSWSAVGTVDGDTTNAVIADGRAVFPTTGGFSNGLAVEGAATVEILDTPGPDGSLLVRRNRVIHAGTDTLLLGSVQTGTSPVDAVTWRLTDDGQVRIVTEDELPPGGDHPYHACATDGTTLWWSLELPTPFSSTVSGPDAWVSDGGSAWEAATWPELPVVEGSEPRCHGSSDGLWVNATIEGDDEETQQVMAFSTDGQAWEVIEYPGTRGAAFAGDGDRVYTVESSQSGFELWEYRRGGAWRVVPFGVRGEFTRSSLPGNATYPEISSIEILDGTIRIAGTINGVATIWHAQVED